MRRLLMLMVGVLASCTSAPALPPLLVVTDDYAVTTISPEGETVELVEADPDRVVSQATWAPDGRLAVWTEVDRAAGVSNIAMGDSQGQRRIDGGTFPFSTHGARRAPTSLTSEIPPMGPG